jgi:hypothetical protein
MVASDGENAVPAQQVEIAVLVAIVEILPTSPPKRDIVADRPQHTDHLLVETAGMKAVTLGLVRVEQGRNVDRHPRYVLILFVCSPVQHLPKTSATQMGGNAA